MRASLDTPERPIRSANKTKLKKVSEQLRCLVEVCGHNSSSRGFAKAQQMQYLRACVHLDYAHSLFDIGGEQETTIEIKKSLRLL